MSSMPDRVPVSDSAPSDETLLAGARAGDDRAFASLVERYEARVAATVVGMLGPGDEAEDVGQETFIRLYRYLDRYRGDASLGTYLTRIAMNLSLTALRKRKRWFSRFVSVESTPGGGSPDSREPGGPGLEMIAVDSDEGPLGRGTTGAGGSESGPQGRDRTPLDGRPEYEGNSGGAGRAGGNGDVTAVASDGPPRGDAEGGTGELKGDRNAG